MLVGNHERCEPIGRDSLCRKLKGSGRADDAVRPLSISPLDLALT